MSVETLVVLLVKYGPAFVMEIIKLCKVKDPTIEQIEAVFAKAQTPFEQGLLPGVIAPVTKTTP